MSTLLRRATRPLAAVTVAMGLATLGACSAEEPVVVGDVSSRDGATSAPAPEQPPAPSPDTDTDGDVSACDEVVAGIEAFNRSDFDETVTRFERAVPLAEAEDAAAGTRRSADLLEAVRYYAALPADDYPEASLTSPDFARYKTITLGQCGSGQPQVPGAPDDDSIPA